MSRITVQYANLDRVFPEYHTRAADLVRALAARPDAALLRPGMWLGNCTLEYSTPAWCIRIYGAHGILWDLKGTLDAVVVDARAA